MKDCGEGSLSAATKCTWMCALWQTKTSLTFQNLSFSECLQRSLREQSENLLPVSSGAASQCVRHGERNEKAAMCDRKWQVGRAGQRLSTKAIRGAGQERREACLFYPHGSIEKHGHALGNQHLAWFKIFLTKSLKKPLSATEHGAWRGRSHCLQALKRAEIHKEIQICIFTSLYLTQNLIFNWAFVAMETDSIQCQTW